MVDKNYELEEDEGEPGRETRRMIVRIVRARKKRQCMDRLRAPLKDRLRLVRVGRTVILSDWSGTQ